MIKIEYSELLTELREVARDAGSEIMKIYESSFDVNYKGDGSPVTLADQAAEKLILSQLKKIIPDIPIVSEENASSHELEAGNQFFGLIENGIPTLGVVFAPALNRMFFASNLTGAFEESENGFKEIKIREVPNSGPVAVASVSHRDELTDNWLMDNNVKKTVSIGSSLKFCLVACGEADVYPRFGPTMEWDTAAGDAVLRSAGGSVLLPNSQPFSYGKQSYRNSAFIAHGNF